MSKQLITQMSRSVCNELLERWTSGALLEKWKGLEGKSLTRAEQVEDRRIRVLAMIIDDDDSKFWEIFRTGRWQTLFAYRDGENVTVELR